MSPIAATLSSAAVPAAFTGPLCARRGCDRPVWKHRLCVYCWRLAQMFGKDVNMFAYKPLDGYSDDRDAVELPWDTWEKEAGVRGLDVADLFGKGPSAGRSGPPRRAP